MAAFLEPHTYPNSSANCSSGLENSWNRVVAAVPQRPELHSEILLDLGNGEGRGGCGWPNVLPSLPLADDPKADD
ncbi:10398_t:CDS:2, partial [Acaulospora colombiana]